MARVKLLPSMVTAWVRDGAFFDSAGVAQGGSGQWVFPQRNTTGLVGVGWNSFTYGVIPVSAVLSNYQFDVSAGGDGGPGMMVVYIDPNYGTLQPEAIAGIGWGEGTALGLGFFGGGTGVEHLAGGTDVRVQMPLGGTRFTTGTYNVAAAAAAGLVQAGLTACIGDAVTAGSIPRNMYFVQESYAVWNTGLSGVIQNATATLIDPAKTHYIRVGCGQSTATDHGVRNVEAAFWAEWIPLAQKVTFT